jgi:predicted dehydrogenase
MGLTHFSILNTHPSVEAVSVCDQSSSMLKIAGKHLDVKTYKDHEKMLAECPLDCAIISTPGDSHADIIKACLRKGLHVFVEKPFTMSARDGEAVLAELEGRPLVNQVGYVNRFNEVFAEVKQLLRDGVIGEVVTFSSEMYGATVLKDTQSSWRGSKKTGGGCMYEFASHCIDLVVYLLDRPDRVAGSVLQSIYSSEVEDLVGSTFFYDRGVSGTILANWSDETFRKPANVVTIMGTKGKIVADKHAYRLYLKEGADRNGFHKGWNTRYITDFAQSVRFYVRGNEFTRQLDHFVDCIEGKADGTVADFAQAHKTDILMEEISRDAAESRLGLGDEPGRGRFGVKPAKRRSIWGRLIGDREGEYA